MLDKYTKKEKLILNQYKSGPYHTMITDLTEKEQDIILKHMWPVTLILPKYKESFIITFVDKYCAIQETLDGLKHNFKFNKR